MLIVFLLASAVALHPAFVKVPQFDQVHVRLLAGGSTCLYAVIGEDNEPPRFEIVHLPGFRREDVTARLLNSETGYREFDWERVEHAIWISANEGEYDCDPSASELRWRKAHSAPTPPTLLSLVDEVSDWKYQPAGESGFLSSSHRRNIAVGVGIDGDVLLWHLSARQRLVHVLPPGFGPRKGLSAAIGDCAVFVGMNAGMLRVEPRSGKIKTLAKEDSVAEAIAMAASSGMVFAATEAGGLFVASESSLTRDLKCPKH